MRIHTKAYGEVDVPDDHVLSFPEGIFAFEHLKRYVLLSAREDSTFHWLQSVDESSLAFLVVRITDILPAYEPRIRSSDLVTLSLGSVTGAEIWGIVTIPPDQPEKMTINLQGPVLINPIAKLGAQFISEDESHPVRALLLQIIEGADARSGT